MRYLFVVSTLCLALVIVLCWQVFALQRPLDARPMSSTWTQGGVSYTLYTPEQTPESVESLTARHLERVRQAKAAITAGGGGS